MSNKVRGFVDLGRFGDTLGSWGFLRRRHHLAISGKVPEEIILL